MTKYQDRSTWDTFKQLWPTVANYKAGLIVAVIALILNAACDVMMTAMLQPLLDNGFIQGGKTAAVEASANQASSSLPNVGGLSDFNLSGIFTQASLTDIATFIVVLIVLRGFSSFASTYCLSWVSGKVVMVMRRRLFNHFMKMPVGFFDKESSGELLSRITYDSEQVSAATSNALINLVREGANIIFLMTLMFWTSWQLSAILLVIAPIVAVAIGVVSKRFRRISSNMQEAMGSVTSSAEQMLKGHKVVLSFGGQVVEKARFDKVSNQMRQQTMKLVSTQAIANPVIQLIASMALVVVLVMAGSESLQGSLTPGSFAVVFGAMFGLMRPLKALTEVTSLFQRGMAACNSLFELMDMETEKDKGTHSVDSVRGEVAVKNVVFTYPTKDTPALKNVSFDLPAGQTLALVGRSGSGKSTIANLLTRFYDISSGDIQLDGVNIEQYTLKNLREHVAIVSQNVHLFNDTIANNIAYAARVNLPVSR